MTGLKKVKVSCENCSHEHLDISENFHHQVAEVRLGFCEKCSNSSEIPSLIAFNKNGKQLIFNSIHEPPTVVTW